MFRKQDFKKIDLLGSGKKHTKIYKVQHVVTGDIFALKEVEAKDIEKLNEYKEEAVQLSKVQNIPNVIQFFGYFFYATGYNTFRLCMVTEYMDSKLNLETLYRKRKKTGEYWTEKELTTFLFSLLATCSLLQQKGICHRDIKPANLFMLPNNEAKLIDFGESKDYFLDLSDDNKPSYTMATIRGTPQYLSPALWKAHVEGNSRDAQHNIYKSDVFSVGLVIYQMACLEEVTGFNNSTETVNGEELIREGIIKLEKLYGKDFAVILATLLTFNEYYRPSFVELEFSFLGYEEVANDTPEGTTATGTNSNSKTSNSNDTLGPGTYNKNELIRQYNKYYNTFNRRPMEPGYFERMSKKAELLSTRRGSILSSRIDSVSKYEKGHQIKSSNLSLEKQGELVFIDERGNSCDTKIYWFEYGGKNIAEFNLIRNKWKIIGTAKEEFPMHFSVFNVRSQNKFYLIGGTEEENFREFTPDALKIIKKKGMVKQRNFFAGVCAQDKIFIFGGYDDKKKTQIKQCEYFDLEKKEWNTIEDLSFERSQAAACYLGDDKIYVIGGFSNRLGVIRSIEEYSIKDGKFQLLDLDLPVGLRRLSLRCYKDDILVFGGIKQCFENNETVYRVNLKSDIIEEWGSLDKGGVIEYEVLFDIANRFHLFLEESNGTSPPFHLKYQYRGKVLEEK